MRKKAAKKPDGQDNRKNTFHKAGEVIDTIGSQILDAKDKAIDAIAEEFKIMTNALTSRLSKSKSLPTARSKRTAAKRATKKATIKETKKQQKKRAPK